MSDVWDDSVAPGGYVCSECGMPTESESCALHDQTLADDVTLAVVESGWRPDSWQFDLIQRWFPPEARP
jgi:hypothetical protein